MNAAPDLLTRTAQPRALIVGYLPPMQHAATCVETLLERHLYPLTIERGGAVIARGSIEDTGSGISLTLTAADNTRVINLHNGTPADACWALGKLLQRYAD